MRCPVRSPSEPRWLICFRISRFQYAGRIARPVDLHRLHLYDRRADRRIGNVGQQARPRADDDHPDHDDGGGDHRHRNNAGWRRIDHHDDEFGLADRRNSELLDTARSPVRSTMRRRFLISGAVAGSAVAANSSISVPSFRHRSRPRIRSQSCCSPDRRLTLRLASRARFAFRATSARPACRGRRRQSRGTGGRADIESATSAAPGLVGILGPFLIEEAVVRQGVRQATTSTSTRDWSRSPSSGRGGRSRLRHHQQSPRSERSPDHRRRQSAAKLAEVITNTRTAVSDAAYHGLVTDRLQCLPRSPPRRLLPAPRYLPDRNMPSIVDETETAHHQGAHGHVQWHRTQVTARRAPGGRQSSLWLHWHREQRSGGMDRSLIRVSIAALRSIAAAPRRTNIQIGVAPRHWSRSPGLRQRFSPDPSHCIVLAIGGASPGGHRRGIL